MELDWTEAGFPTDAARFTGRVCRFPRFVAVENIFSAFRSVALADAIHVGSGPGRVNGPLTQFSG